MTSLASRLLCIMIDRATFVMYLWSWMIQPVISLQYDEWVTSNPFFVSYSLKMSFFGHSWLKVCYRCWPKVEWKEIKIINVTIPLTINREQVIYDKCIIYQYLRAGLSGRTNNTRHCLYQLYNGKTSWKFKFFFLKNINDWHILVSIRMFVKNV